jgi:tRNA (adenine22-N1)-methyltransferase
MPSIKLSPRLQAAADLVSPCRRVIDIGTDHAFLPIHLVQVGRCHDALAIDLREGPLRIATRHIAAAGLERQIAIQQNNGLRGIVLDDQDVVVLAGLGGLEIRDILAADGGRCHAIVVQAMKSMPELRGWLAGNGYGLTAERLVHDRGRFYVIAACHPAAGQHALSRLEEWIGPRILQERPPGFSDYLLSLLPRLQKMLHADGTMADLIEQIQGLARQTNMGGSR